jgi:drug/metabolite transporter (DMT)-like permease
MTAILLALGSSIGYGVSDFLASRVAKRVPPVLLVLYSQVLQSVVLLVVVVAVSQPYSAGGLAWGTAVLFGLFFVLVDLGGVAAGASVLWVALGIQLGALPTTLAGALGSRGRRRLGDDPALLRPVVVLTVLNLSGDGFLAYAVTRGDLAVVAVLASLAPVVTAVCAHVLTAERPTWPQAAGAALAVLGTLVVSAAQAAG